MSNLKCPNEIKDSELNHTPMASLTSAKENDPKEIVEDYVILPRPSKNISGSNFSNLPEGLEPIVYSDEESEESVNDSDSDDEPKTKRRHDWHPFHEKSKVEGMDTDTACSTSSKIAEKMLSFQEKRTKNNVWSQVLSDEMQHEATEQLGFVNMDSRRIQIERGPESYGFKHGDKGPSRKRKSNPFRKVERDPGDTDVSDTGLSDDDLEYIQKNEATIREGKEAGNKIHEGSFTETSKVTMAEAKAMLYKLNGKKLGQFIAKELLEPKKQMINRAVELLGRTYCVKMFLKTLKVELKGGLLIKNQSRRRTPGGIFMHMIRKDEKFSEELKGKVFGAEEKKGKDIGSPQQ